MRGSHYEWLIVVEGQTDLKVFREYLCSKTCKIESAGGKHGAINMPHWNDSLTKRLETDLGREAFRGVILVVDSDDHYSNPFCGYNRSDKIRYSGNKLAPSKDPSQGFWHLDNLNGKEKVVPLRGINVPFINRGGLETELLSAYGFPTKDQPEYCTLADIVKRATCEWAIPNDSNGNPWWSENETAKMDKFIYASLREGFATVTGKRPKLPHYEPDVISRIRSAIK